MSEKPYHGKPTCCHPDRPHKANGMCDKCFNLLYVRREAVPTERELLLEELGLELEGNE